MEGSVTKVYSDDAIYQDSDEDEQTHSKWDPNAFGYDLGTKDTANGSEDYSPDFVLK